ncbi:coiled-coil domain-containing protein [Mycoplasmopsis iners]|uniref:hypothetical protein n=1 Tax=Mycoplasmopsis iners TaxID=76630 RepID=UPI00055C633C|nr:hypothetical protein [Mycoplasmopsis iners]
MKNKFKKLSFVLAPLAATATIAPMVSAAPAYETKINSMTQEELKKALKDVLDSLMDHTSADQAVQEFNRAELYFNYYKRVVSNAFYKLFPEEKKPEITFDFGAEWLTEMKKGFDTYFKENIEKYVNDGKYDAAVQMAKLTGKYAQEVWFEKELFNTLIKFYEKEKLGQYKELYVEAHNELKEEIASADPSPYGYDNKIKPSMILDKYVKKVSAKIAEDLAELKGTKAELEAKKAELESVKTELEQVKAELEETKAKLAESDQKLNLIDGSVKTILQTLQNNNIVLITDKVTTLMKELNETYGLDNQKKVDLGKNYYFLGLLPLSQEAIKGAMESIKQKEYWLTVQQITTASSHYGDMITQYVSLEGIKSLLANMSEETKEWFMQEANNIKDEVIRAKSQEYASMLNGEPYVPRTSDLYEAYAKAILKKLEQSNQNKQAEIDRLKATIQNNETAIAEKDAKIKELEDQIKVLTAKATNDNDTKIADVVTDINNIFEKNNLSEYKLPENAQKDYVIATLTKVIGDLLAKSNNVTPTPTPTPGNNSNSTHTVEDRWWVPFISVTSVAILILLILFGLLIHRLRYWKKR